MADLDNDSDDYGYDLTLDDEKLLISLADGPPLPSSTNNNNKHNATAALSSCGSSVDKTTLVGVARTSNIDAFVRKTQPQSAPSIVPADDVQYPDRRYPSISVSVHEPTAKKRRGY